MLIENLVIYTRKPYTDSNGKNIHHSFPVPKESDQYIAQHWSGWDKHDGSANMINFEENSRKFPVFSGVELIDLDHRGNGGRAYQVLIPISGSSNDYLRCDMREDALFDTMMLSGVEQGGKLNGEFAFVRNGSQTNLIPVGSKEYLKHLKMAEKKKMSKTISNKDLKVGYYYSTPNGDENVYLGVYYQHGSNRVDSTTDKVDDKPTAYHVFARLYDESYTRFIFKKTHHFTVESEQPRIREDEAKQLIQDEYIKKAENSIESILTKIESVYEIYLERWKTGVISSKDYYLDFAKRELSILKSEAFEAYRKSRTNTVKSEVDYNRNEFALRIKESEVIAMEKVQGEFKFTF